MGSWRPGHRGIRRCPGRRKKWRPPWRPATPSSSSHPRSRLPPDWRLRALRCKRGCPRESWMSCRAPGRVRVRRWSPILWCGWCPLPGEPKVAGASAKKPPENRWPGGWELGGKSPHILFADADVDAAVAAVAEGIFEGSGQSCVAGSRLFVHESIHHVVLKKLLERARSLRVDLPDAPGAEMGPLATFAQRDKVQAMVDEARAAGASILAGGTRPDACALANGAY